MLKASELAAKHLMSADEHKRVSTTLRRLSGGIGAQRSNALDLSDKEQAILIEAASLLDRMAEVSSQAAKLRRKEEERADARRAAIRTAITSNFGALSTVAEKVALIGAVQSYSLRNNAEAWGANKHMLAEVFREALDGLTWTLGQSAADKPPAQVVAEAWAKFQAGRSAIEDQHARLIVALQRLHDDQPRTG